MASWSNSRPSAESGKFAWPLQANLSDLKADDRKYLLAYHSMPKHALYLQEGNHYLAIKVSRERRLNAGALEKHPEGTLTGTLNARTWLIELIEQAGGDFKRLDQYNRAEDYELRRGGGAGYEGWVDFGSHENALEYLGRYFRLKHCRGRRRDVLKPVCQQRRRVNQPRLTA